ncbi:unnamed protein product [Lactuca saligna]|uniref:Uncharacterized protein n=1 Tax=Lactuca saligna TaxID=75948 RepID=A0AA35Y435_LACSI|nr:unnamed protein product [Lactuca saligna]
MPISGLCEKHKQELENMTLIAQPFKTLKLFIVVVLQYITRSLHVEVLLEYARFGLWWVALGVTSSIGLELIGEVWNISFRHNYIILSVNTCSSSKPGAFNTILCGGIPFFGV